MDEELNVRHDKLAILVIGMAGTGKTTFVKALSNKLTNSMIINLDPAVYKLPYEPHVDIRTQINYKELMTTHKLGPNGAILTALNLYCLQLNHLIKNIEDSQHEVIIVDTPGQIEAFTWSSSGTLISQTFCMSMPTIIIYLIDSARCLNPNSFMSNLLFCCSIFYKMKLPTLVAFNKSDIADSNIPIDWLRNYDSFTNALSQNQNYLSTLSKQMVLTLEEFYNNFQVIQISALKETGFDFQDQLSKLKQEYFEVTLVDIQNDIKKKKQKQAQELIEKMKNLQTH